MNLVLGSGFFLMLCLSYDLMGMKECCGVLGFVCKFLVCIGYKYILIWNLVGVGKIIFV